MQKSTGPHLQLPEEEFEKGNRFQGSRLGGWVAASISFINLTLPLGGTLPNWICHQLIIIFIFIVIIIILILINVTIIMQSSPSSIFLFVFIFSYSIMTQKNSQAPDHVSCKFKHDESTKPVSGCQFQICCYETFILSDAQKSSKVCLLLLLMLCSCLENFGFNPDFVEAVPIF